MFLIVLNAKMQNRWGPGGLSGGRNPARATTLTSESDRQSGRLGVWLYGSHTRARVARGEEREPASSEIISQYLTLPIRAGFKSVSNSQSVSQSVNQSSRSRSNQLASLEKLEVIHSSSEK